MDIGNELIIISKLIVSFLLGAFIGYDRERHGRDARIRTYTAVSIGATLFTIIGEPLSDTAAASRIIANIVVGIGFLGAGIIYRNNASNTSHGLTTAATIWRTAAIGVAVGLDMFLTAIIGASALYFLLVLHHQRWHVKWKQKILNNQNEQSCDD